MLWYVSQWQPVTAMVTGKNLPDYEGDDDGDDNFEFGFGED